MTGDELTPKDVAREFNVSTSTVRRWDRPGWLRPTRILPGSRHRRYSRQDVDAFRKLYDEGLLDGEHTA